MNKKRILQIILVVLIIILIGLLIWFFLRPQTDITAPEPGTGEPIIETPGGGGTIPETPLPGTGGETGGETGGISTPTPETPTPSTGSISYGNLSLLFKPILRQVSTEPIAGSTIFNKGGRQFIRFTDRATGHIFETDAEIIKLSQITNTTVPKVYEAIWQKNGEGAIYRYLRSNGNIASFAGTIRTSGGGEFRGQFLEDNISGLAVSEGDNSLLYFLTNNLGQNSLVSSSFFGTNKSIIWSSPLSEWLPIVSQNGNLAVISKASGTSQGSLITLDKSGNIKNYLLTGIYGLSASISPDATGAIYSSSKTSDINLWVKNKDSSPKNLLLKTLGEKCVWRDSVYVFCAIPENIPSGEYPDDWYQGTKSFKDEIYLINTDTGVVNYLINLSREANVDFDVDLMGVSPDKRFLTLRNKNNLILWSLQVSK